MNQITDTRHVRSVASKPLVTEPAHVDQEILHRLTGLIGFGASLLNSLICMRFLLKLLAADPANPFAGFVYSTTEPFLSVFHGITRTPYFNGVTFEIHTLIAITVYSLLAWAVIQLLRIMFARIK